MVYPSAEIAEFGIFTIICNHWGENLHQYSYIKCAFDNRCNLRKIKIQFRGSRTSLNRYQYHSDQIQHSILLNQFRWILKGFQSSILNQDRTLITISVHPFLKHCFSTKLVMAAAARMLKLMSLPISAEKSPRENWTRPNRRKGGKLEENDTSRTSKSCWRIIDTHTHAVHRGMWCRLFPMCVCVCVQHQTLNHKAYPLAAPERAVHWNSIIIITIYRFNHFDPIFRLRARKRASRICARSTCALANNCLWGNVCIQFQPTNTHTHTHAKYRALNIVSITEINRMAPREVNESCPFLCHSRARSCSRLV